MMPSKQSEAATRRSEKAGDTIRGVADWLRPKLGV